VGKFPRVPEPCRRALRVWARPVGTPFAVPISRTIARAAFKVYFRKCNEVRLLDGLGSAAVGHGVT